MERDLGKPIVVVNKVGGGGAVGFKAIAAAKPDGYTIGLISTSMLLQKYSSITYVDYHTIKPIALINEDPASLTVKRDAPWSSLLELLEYARKNPGKIRVSNSGPGAIWHVAALALEKEADVRFTHIPYEGGNPAAVAVAGGHVEVTTVSPAECGPLVDAGELRILAIPAVERQARFPNVPTFKEAGMDFTFGTWRAFAVPKNTPDEIINVLGGALERAVNTQQYKEFMTKGGFGMRFMNADELQAYMDEQDAQFAELFKTLDIKKN
jgi:tripartite-type tricarboxylate transporter receptor subunit TctC